MSSESCGVRKAFRNFNRDEKPDTEHSGKSEAKRGD